MTNWRLFYQAALLETDPDAPNDFLVEAETAMWKRLRELDEDSAGYNHPERKAIEAAAATLLALKIERLGWPNPFATQPRNERSAQ